MRYTVGPYLSNLVIGVSDSVSRPTTLLLSKSYIAASNYSSSEINFIFSSVNPNYPHYMYWDIGTKI